MGTSFLFRIFAKNVLTTGLGRGMGRSLSRPQKLCGQASLTALYGVGIFIGNVLGWSALVVTDVASLFSGYIAFMV